MSGCIVHKHRDTVPLDVHHVFPRGAGGPDIASNRIVVCPNGHRRIHDYIRLLLKHQGQVPWPITRLFGPKVRHYARAGYDQIIAKGTAAHDGE